MRAQQEKVGPIRDWLAESAPIRLFPFVSQILRSFFSVPLTACAPLECEFLQAFTRQLIACFLGKGIISVSTRPAILDIRAILEQIWVLWSDFGTKCCSPLTWWARRPNLCIRSISSKRCKLVTETKIASCTHPQ